MMYLSVILIFLFLCVVVVALTTRGLKVYHITIVHADGAEVKTEVSAEVASDDNRL